MCCKCLLTGGLNNISSPFLQGKRRKKSLALCIDRLLLTRWKSFCSFSGWRSSFKVTGVFLFLKILFYLANSADSDKMLPYAVFLGLRSLPKDPKGFTLTLQETRSVHDSMNIPKIKFIAYLHFIINYLKSKRYS